jgi:hypothetical protein
LHKTLTSLFCTSSLFIPWFSRLFSVDISNAEQATHPNLKRTEH